MKRKGMAFLKIVWSFSAFLLFFIVSFLVFAEQRGRVYKNGKADLLSQSEKQELLETDQRASAVDTVSEAKHKKSEAPNSSAETKQKQSPASYSFRPLLIQGKKRLVQKTKDMKVDSGNIAESKLFFIEIDFKKRIFEQDDIE